MHFKKRKRIQINCQTPSELTFVLTGQCLNYTYCFKTMNVDAALYFIKFLPQFDVDYQSCYQHSRVWMTNENRSHSDFREQILSQIPNW